MKGVHITDMAETLECIDTTSNKIVCPFRTFVIAGQHLNDDGIPEQYQITTFPECQYKLCPYYEFSSKPDMNKCLRVGI